MWPALGAVGQGPQGAPAQLARGYTQRSQGAGGRTPGLAAQAQQQVPGADEVMAQGTDLVDGALDDELGGRRQLNPLARLAAAATATVLDRMARAREVQPEAGQHLGRHAAVRPQQAEEQIDFNLAVEAVIAWVNVNSNWGETLLIVTGDHETGYLTGPGSDPTWQPLVNNGAGNLPGMQWNGGDHTNSLLPLFAKGDAARLLHRYADVSDPVRGPYIDNTELAWVLLAVFE